MLFSDTHEWVKVEGKSATVGITSHAQNELGEIVFIQLPQVGEIIKAGGEIVVLESTKAAADIYTPVSGTVTEVNSALATDPDLLNRSPEEGGWLFRVALSNLEQLDVLLSEEKYRELVNS